MNHCMEFKYSIPVWTSKIVLEHGKPLDDEIMKSHGSKTIIQMCFENLKYNTDNWEQDDINHYNSWMNDMKQKYHYPE